MKRQTIYMILAGAAILFSASACKKSFFTDVNKNPNAVDTVPPYLLLPSCEISLAFDQGGDFSRNASLIDQQVFGLSNQTATFYQYGINPGTFENTWTDMYTSAMENTHQLILISDALQQNAYSGVARILMAYELMMMVDTWGSVPYSQAFGGNLPESQGTIQPKYDSDQALYDSIALLVDSGIARFALDPGLAAPADVDDVMFKGDLTGWTKFGHAIKARLFIHQSKDDAAKAASAIAEVDQSFQNIDTVAQYPFLGNGNTTNPWVQFLSDRADYISFNESTLTAMMIDKVDPRLPKMVDTANNVLGDFYGSSNSPVEYITYEELQFIKAEATLRSGGSLADAQTAYTNAVTANMDKLGVSGGARAMYLAANGTLPVVTADAIAQVAAEEYTALFLNPEAWTLYRRTGVPNLVPSGTGSVPRRFLYPQSEYSYNAANVPASTLSTPRIFWDK